MLSKKLSQDGFHIIELAIVVAVLAIIGFVGLKVLHKDKAANTDQSAVTSGASNTGNAQAVQWAFNSEQLKWFTQTGTATRCADPFVFDASPVDLSKIMVIGIPGAYRGYNYKPHGGMRRIDMESGKIVSKRPTDATLTGITRYFEGNPAELQYLLTFETDCGIAFRFDHIYSLTPAFQAIAETTPEPKKDDTSGNPNAPFTRTKFTAGDVVATAVGFPRIKNFGFDFGVYAYRKRNTISKNKTWAAIHTTYQATEWFGACWPDMLPAPDKARAKELSLVVINPAKPNLISDYCSFAPHTTLDFNNGQPTDG